MTEIFGLVEEGLREQGEIILEDSSVRENHDWWLLRIRPRDFREFSATLLFC